MLDVQDFFFCLTQYDELKTETAVDYIQAIAKRLHRFSNDSEDFVEAIKQMDMETLKERREYYRNTKKVNRIKFLALDQFIENKKLTVEDLEQIKEQVNNEYDTNILHSWSNFTILFQIYYQPIKAKIQHELANIHQAIRNIEEFGEQEFAKDKVLNGFSWNQNFGCTESWLAVYPADKETHKRAGQFFMSIEENRIRYGLLFGTEHPNHGEEDLDSITDSEEFSFNRFKEKFINVFPAYLKGNEVKSPNGGSTNNSLAEPFNLIFKNLEEAHWAFDFTQQTLKDLGVEGPGDPRVAVTYTYRELGEALHVNFCRWLLLGFYKDEEGNIIVRIPLMEEKSLSQYPVYYQFKQQDSDSIINCYLIPLKDLRPMDAALEENYSRALTVIKNRFATHTKSPYRKQHNSSALEMGVFDREKREELFNNGLHEQPTGGSIEEDDDYVPIPALSFDQDININGLHFEEKDFLLKQIKTALQNGKHIILTGPPGTGKSKLAKEICNSFEADYDMATATSDWSTYETIGGYRPNADGTLSFSPGIFLNCFKDSTTNKPINKWLIIDEMNRADIDKAFGALFSALTGDAVTLNFQSESGKLMLLRPQNEEKSVIPNDYEYIIPNDWRLIGTMNTMDKASLYEMSYAFMRRFAFIPVGVPREINEHLVDSLLSKWDLHDYPYSNILAAVWEQINEYRKIGPAIVEDLAKYTMVDGDFTSAIMLYVLPQFEGLFEHQILEFVERLGNLDEVIDTERLRLFAQDFFHI
ncbi:AAA family ATPase [Pseudalkalibacillus caeni]|uniref:AAA family ATPase n=2 Tax=Exobacillus caeni TaxID=2574798 RepID=A0A5R9F3C7_9BACL|nr:AAA family ATPase [Pseudalkalibacillus caeni]